MFQLTLSAAKIHISSFCFPILICANRCNAREKSVVSSAKAGYYVIRIQINHGSSQLLSSEINHQKIRKKLFTENETSDFCIITMKKAITILLILVPIVYSCKKKEEKKVEEKQVLGSRYPDGNIWIYSQPGSKKKEDKIALIYDLEEVEGLEIAKGDDGKDYLKMKTSTGKIGYGIASRFVEAVYFTINPTVMAYKKPTLTAPTAGKLDISALCYVKTFQGEWVNANCYSAKTEFGQKPETFYNVWLQTSDNGLSKDPLLGQSALNIHKSRKLIAKISDDPTQKNEAVKLLKMVQEKEDIFQTAAGEILKKLEILDNETMPEEPVIPEGSENTPPGDQ